MRQDAVHQFAVGGVVKPSESGGGGHDDLRRTEINDTMGRAQAATGGGNGLWEWCLHCVIVLAKSLLLLLCPVFSSGTKRVVLRARKRVQRRQACQAFS